MTIKKIHLVLANLLAFVLMQFIVPMAVLAANCDEISCNKDTQSVDQYLDCNRSKQSCLEDNLNQTRQAANTLKNTIAILNGQMSLQQLQIDQSLAEINKLEKEINDLTTRITGLGMSLDRLTTLLLERIQAEYKLSRLSTNANWLMEGSFTNLLAQYKYVQAAQAQTTNAMQRTESQRLIFDDQKKLKEVKQDELAVKKQKLEKQRQELVGKKAEQQFLLTETQNNEAKYQKELEKTLAELQAIQSIIAGKGSETKVRDVNQGDTIASIIVGASACSTGTHLHFEVVKNKVNYNPASYLKPIDILWSNQPDGSFGFGGNWDWPVNNAARITQGYGMTYYARVKRAYGGQPHTGLDILSKTTSDVALKAVKSGTLYRGSIACGGGQLRYVRVEHKEDGISTYYLHVNY